MRRELRDQERTQLADMTDMNVCMPAYLRTAGVAPGGLRRSAPIGGFTAGEFESLEFDRQLDWHL